MARTRKVTPQANKTPFDKYKAYSIAVQNPEVDVRFLRRVYRECVDGEPYVLREDFCAAFELCTAWAGLGSEYKAIGLDIDPEPIEYGSEKLAALSPDKRKRIKILQQDVLTARAPKVDIVCALNFSYSIFKDRPTLLSYFKRVRQGVSKHGVFIMDNFGGPYTYSANVETRRYPGFIYQFEQTYLDPLTHQARWAIHFTPKNGKRIKNAFTYDWRLWSIPELRDLLLEAGFKDVVYYLEGTDAKGNGTGKFRWSTKGEEWGSWLSYIVGLT